MVDVNAFGFGTSVCYVCSDESHRRMGPRAWMEIDYEDENLTLRRHPSCERDEQKIELYKAKFSHTLGRV